MISKIGKGQEFRSVVNYILEKGKGTEILDSDGVMLYSSDSIIRTFNFQTELNPRLSKPVGHISLNFSFQDKEKLSNELMVQITHDYMNRMGISETQYLIGRHYDKEHPHLHLIFNRVNNYGRTISDRFDHTRSEKICKELTLEYKLYFASGKEKVNENRLWEPDKTKYEIYDYLKAIIPQSQNWDQLICALQEQNIGVAFNFKEETDKIQGIIFNKNGYFFSGSKVDRQFSYSRIDQQLKLGEQK
jgi:hypothetical protein